MSSIQPSLQSSAFGHRTTFDPAAAWRRNLARKLRWIIAWAALLALAVVAFKGSEGIDPTAELSPIQAEEPVDPAVFDGRGKWLGYAQ